MRDRHAPRRPEDGPRPPGDGPSTRPDDGPDEGTGTAAPRAQRPAPGGEAGGGDPGSAPPEDREAAPAPGAATVEWRVRRVLVALDASPASRAAASTAARLAAQLQAELAGLFVEDSRLAGWSGASEVGSYSATPRPLAGHEMERRLRAQAARARRMFESLAAGAAVEGSFEVVRGTVTREVVAAAGEGALLSLGRVGTGGTARLGSVARAALTEGRGSLLLLPSGGRLAPPVLVVFGDGAGAGGPSRAPLTAAARLAHALAGVRAARAQGGRRGGAAGMGSPAGPGAPQVVVLIPPRGGAGGGTEAEGAWLRQEARSHLAPLGVEVRFHRPDPDQHRRTPPDAWATRHLLAHAVASERANALVLPADSPLTDPAELEAVVEGLGCAVLLLR